MVIERWQGYQINDGPAFVESVCALLIRALLYMPLGKNPKLETSAFAIVESL